MKNNYEVFLTNDQGCIFDSEIFTNLKEAKKWAAGRGTNYSTKIHKNGKRFLEYRNK